MTDFPAPLSEPTPPDPKRQRILRQDWEWVWERGGTKDRIFIPKSTEDTLVKWEPSIPTWAQSFIPDDALEIPALPHDIIYKLQGEMPPGIIQRWDKRKWKEIRHVGRKYADDLFRDLAIHTGVKEWRVKAAYRGVRLGGWWAWQEKDDFELPTR